MCLSHCLCRFWLGDSHQPVHSCICIRTWFGNALSAKKVARLVNLPLFLLIPHSSMQPSAKIKEASVHGGRSLLCACGYKRWWIGTTTFKRSNVQTCNPLTHTNHKPPTTRHTPHATRHTPETRKKQTKTKTKTKQTDRDNPLCVFLFLNRHCGAQLNWSDWDGVLVALNSGVHSDSGM